MMKQQPAKTLHRYCARDGGYKRDRYWAVYIYSEEPGSLRWCAERSGVSVTS